MGIEIISDKVPSTGQRVQNLHGLGYVSKKSFSLRVLLAVQAASSPWATSKLQVKDKVPCRLYSNSRRKTLPGRIGKIRVFTL